MQRIKIPNNTSKEMDGVNKNFFGKEYGHHHLPTYLISRDKTCKLKSEGGSVIRRHHDANAAFWQTRMENLK